MVYDKPPLNIQQQIEILLERKLIIADVERAKKYLKTVSYFRLSGYMFNLQSKDGKHNFTGDVTFDNIITQYHFDKKLRLLMYDYIERIEVAVRTLISNEFSIIYGFFWYSKRELFVEHKIQDEVLHYISEDFKKESEQFIKKFKSKYTSENLPPSNMAMESLTFGKLARFYSALKNTNEKQNIADCFKLPHVILSSWLTYLANVRNVCAHHGRLWNRKITADRFTIPSKKSCKFNGEITDDFNTTVYGVVSIMVRLLNEINPKNSFLEKFETLVKDFPFINYKDMGFPDNWKENPAWK